MLRGGTRVSLAQPILDNLTDIGQKVVERSLPKTVVRLKFGSDPPVLLFNSCNRGGRWVKLVMLSCWLQNSK